MLSYQHLYHAGNFADVHKHAILLDCLNYLQRKASPICFYDTHSARGLYDFTSDEANKTGEYHDGIFKLRPKSGVEQIDHYLEQIEQCVGNDKESYPGSPYLIANNLREQDELHASEAHPGEFNYLRTLLKNMDGIHLHHRDGYEMLKGLFPPKTPRAMVLIDPSYEVKDEYSWVASSVIKLYKKWQKTTVLIWYPLLPAAQHEAMIAELSAAGIQKILRSEITVKCREGVRGMYGSGMLIINPPYDLRQQGPQWLSLLAEQLSNTGQATTLYMGDD